MSTATRLKSSRGITAGQDEGFAMIMVIGVTGVIAVLIAVGSTLGINALRSSRSHVNFETALAVAETGIDAKLAAINANYNAGSPVSDATAAPCALTAPATFADENAERVWASTQMSALPASCLTTLSSGQYLSVRPTNRRAVYSMAWVPRRGAVGVKKRLIKGEYLFAPYKPSNAVLTQSSLDFSGSVAISSIVSTTPSDVHSNADVSGYNGSTNIAGALSASGSATGGCTSGIVGGCSAGAAIQSIPTISARTYYNSLSSTYASGWYDLCPDGTMHSASTSTPPVPCNGTTLATTNGWDFTAGSGSTPPIWTLPRTAGGPYNGVYYVYQGNAQIGSNGNSSDTWQISVLAEAQTTGITNAATCNKLGGDVTWKLFNMTPYLSGLQLLADANLTGDANASAGSGLFLAGDKVSLSTSSSVLTGAVVASNKCAAQGPNAIQGVAIHYDDTLESPLSDIIRTSLWLDYAAG